MYIALVSGLAAPADGNGLVPFGTDLNNTFNAVVQNFKWDQDKSIMNGYIRTTISVVIAHSYGANSVQDALRAAKVQVDLLILINPVHINWWLPWNWFGALNPWVTKDIAKKCICYFNQTFPPNAYVIDGFNRDMTFLGLGHSDICASEIIHSDIENDIKGIL